MAFACSRDCLETAIHEAGRTKATLRRSRAAVRAALAAYHKADRRLTRALARVQGVAHPKRLDLKRFAEHELGELEKTERELRELRPFVPRQKPPKHLARVLKRKAAKKRKRK